MESYPLSLQVKADTNPEAAIDGMVPDFRDSRKKEFLVLRSSNFSITEALMMVGATSQEYNTWKSSDPVFADWAVNHIWELQHSWGTEVLMARFKRCVFLQLSIDSDVLAKRAYDPDSMTPADREDARAAAQRYNAQSIAAMVKIMDPGYNERRPERAPMQVELSVNVGLSDIEQYAERKAQARKLLQTFTDSSHHVDIIDAESVVT